MDCEMTTYYFDVLPAHPSPAYLESFTSYLTRLAEANLFTRYSDLARRIFPDRNGLWLREMRDYPIAGLSRLSQETTCSPSALLATTFYHLLRKFGRLPEHTNYRGMFFHQALSPHLRYCPSCVRESPYYRLPWRFLALTGCPIHACALLDCCPDCGRSIRLFASHLRIGVCPHCAALLGSGSSPILSGQELRHVQECYLDLEYLLLPQPWETGSRDASAAVGDRLKVLRRLASLSTLQVAEQTGIPLNNIRTMENGRARYSAPLPPYLHYAHYLNVSLRQLFADGLAAYPLIPRENFPSYDEWLATRLELVVRQLQADEQPITDATLRERTGISLQTFRGNATPRSLLAQAERAAFQEREQALLDQLENLVQTVEAEGRPLYRQEVFDTLQKDYFTLRPYPRVAERLRQLDFAKPSKNPTRFKVDEQTLLQQVHQAIADLQAADIPITQEAIAAQVWMCSHNLRAYPQVEALLHQTRALRNAQRDAQLAAEVRTVIQYLTDMGLPVSCKAVSKVLGLSVATLARYPTVHQMFVADSQQAALNRKTERLQRVSEAIASLRASRLPMTRQAICLEAGLRTGADRYYADIRQLIEPVVAEWESGAEQRLLKRVEQAIEELRQTGPTLTLLAICHHLGISQACLRSYPAVVAVVSEARFTARRDREDQLIQQIQAVFDELKAQQCPLTQKAVCDRIGLTPNDLVHFRRAKTLVHETTLQWHREHNTNWWKRFGVMSETTNI
jgi:transcriptional regulator with XRE-family HTH domain